MVKFATDASGAMLLPNLVQVTESISGSDVPVAMFQKQLNYRNIHFEFSWQQRGGRQN